MPELPEVETSRRGIEPWLVNQSVVDVIVRNPRLRWPIPSDLPMQLVGEVVRTVSRRGKYLLIEFEHGTLLIHLGMSGNLRIVPADTELKPHDHLDLVLESSRCLRLNDPRRFGAVLWTENDPAQHPLLISLGPEPLDNPQFNADYLYELCQRRRCSIKQLLMDNQVVVGVGNIYACEALFESGVYPGRSSSKITLSEATLIVKSIKSVLARAIEQGGTTLKDFNAPDGKPGYFAQELLVYGRADQPCYRCSTEISTVRLGQRNTYFCSKCQV